MLHGVLGYLSYLIASLSILVSNSLPLGRSWHRRPTRLVHSSSTNRLTSCLVCRIAGQQAEAERQGLVARLELHRQGADRPTSAPIPA